MECGSLTRECVESTRAPSGRLRMRENGKKNKPSSDRLSQLEAMKEKSYYH